MGRISRKSSALLSAINPPLWGVLFHVYGLTGKSRYSNEKFRVLYAGTRPFFHYFKQSTFAESPEEEFLGLYNILELRRVRQRGSWDLEVFRGHKLLANLGLFPSCFFVPEWVSGTSSLVQDALNEQTSRSRRRDRALLRKSELGYAVTVDPRDLDFFYEEMYLPHMHQRHGESVSLMTRESMMSRVKHDKGELVMIYRGNDAVGGSFVVQEKGRPRLYSQGVLQNDKNLFRLGVGTAVYLYSFDHLADCGFDEVHMGWTRALLSDGSLYFKQRFGFLVRESSEIGHFFNSASVTLAAIKYLENTGFISYRRGVKSAELFRASDAESSVKLLDQKRLQCSAMGLSRINVTDLSHAVPDIAVRID